MTKMQNKRNICYSEPNICYSSEWTRRYPIFTIGYTRREVLNYASIVRIQCAVSISSVWREQSHVPRGRILNAIYDNYEIIKSAERKLISSLSNGNGRYLGCWWSTLIKYPDGARLFTNENVFTLSRSKLPFRVSRFNRIDALDSEKKTK